MRFNQDKYVLVEDVEESKMTEEERLEEEKAEIAEDNTALPVDTYLERIDNTPPREDEGEENGNSV